MLPTFDSIGFIGGIIRPIPLPGKQGTWNLSLTYSKPNLEVCGEPAEPKEGRIIHLSLRHITEDGKVTEFGHRSKYNTLSNAIQNLAYRVL